jgi:hypothetical protein
MDRAFTFGIITDGSPEAIARLRYVIDTIECERIPAYEILIVGNLPAIERRNTRVLSFDESIKPRWITRKKNLITENARFDHIVYMHDYLALEPGWYAGWKSFPAFHACMNPILNADGTRYRDWSLFYDASSQAARDFAGIGRLENLLPYEETSLSRLMYFSGAYWVATRDTMRKLPLDERLTWGDGEDVVWSHRYRARHDFMINTASRVRLFGKKKDPIFKPVPPEKLARLKDYVAAHPPQPGYGCSDDMNHWREHGHWGDTKPQVVIGGAV